MRTESIPATAVQATNYALRLVRQLRHTQDIVVWLDGNLRSARQSLEHARHTREIELGGDVTPRPDLDAKQERLLRFYDGVIAGLRRDVASWRKAIPGIVAGVSRTVAGLDALFDSLAARGCRSILKLLTDDHGPTRFGDCEPTAWQAFTACSLAKRVLFKLADADGTCPTLADLDETGIEAELNLALPMTENVLRILVSPEALDGLDLELKRDQAALGCAADEAERNDDRLALEYSWAELVATGAEWPGGAIECRPIRIEGMTPEAESRLRQILKHAEPHLRALGADFTTGELDDNAERVAGWFARRPGAQSLPAEPFVYIPAVLSRLLDEQRQAEQPAERAPAKVTGHVVDAVSDGSPEQLAGVRATDNPLADSSQGAKTDQTPENVAQTIRKGSRRGRLPTTDTSLFLAWVGGRWNENIGITENCEVYADEVEVADERRSRFVARMRSAYDYHFGKRRSADNCAPKSLRADK